MSNAEASLSQLHDTLVSAGVEVATGPQVQPSMTPERATAIAEAVMVDPKPVPPGPVNNRVELPGGWINPMNGELVRFAHVRELTGEDEEIIYAAQENSRPLEVVDKVIKNATVDLGGMVTGSDMLGSLLVGDRDALGLAIYIATYGSDFPLTPKCLACGEINSVTMELEKDIPVKPMDDPMQRTVTITTRKGSEIRARLLTGDDVMSALAALPKFLNIAALNTLLIGRALESVDGKSVRELPQSPQVMAKQMAIPDRTALLTALDAAQPGPSWDEVKCQCSSCGEDIPINVSLASLLLG